MGNNKKEELKPVSELPGFQKVKGASGGLGLIGGVLSGAATTFGRISGAFATAPKQYFKRTTKGVDKKPFWPQTKNTGDLYAKARARKTAESGPKVKTMKDLNPKVKGYDVEVLGQNPKPKTNIITKGELHGNVRAFNQPGMKKSVHGYGANPNPKRWGR